MFNKIFIIIVCLFSFSVMADDNCLRFRYDVDINIKNNTDNNVVVEKSAENLVGRLGYTVSNITYSYQLLMVPVRVENGYCLSLRSIDIDVSPKFNIVLDKRLKENSCAYKIVYQHEQDHKDVYEKILKDNIDNIKSAVIEATKSVKPVFLKNIDKANDVEIEISNKLEKYSEVEKIKEKIKNLTDEENKKIDTRGDDYKIWKCKDFFDEMKEFYGSMTID